ncbi:MAG: acetylglutamate kinase [Sediminibacterium sp.]|nr:acetylglutamate kinase [Sediminibacterium sp.]
MEKISIIKIGGNIIDNEANLASFLNAYAAVEGKKILIHGGGKLATKMAADLNIPQQMVDGRRITDAATLKIVTMVYAGYINKNIVAALQSKNIQALGICGADANIIRAHKRINASTDYGFVGDIDAVDSEKIIQLLEAGLSLVIAPITHDGAGQLLNTNADTMAQAIATAVSSMYEVSLVYSFEKKGVLSDIQNNDSVIPVINPENYTSLKASGQVNEGMIPKLDNAFEALQKGVNRVIIGDALDIEKLIAGKTGTTIQKN